MKRTAAVIGCAVLAGAIALKSVRSQPAAQTTVGGNAALLVTLGEGARSQERWDGSVVVTGGRLTGIEGRHFSTGDTTEAAGSWKCTTRRDEVAPYADINYTEMRPGSQPAVLFHPVGVYLTLEGGSGARAAVSTAQGNFEFAVAEMGVEPKSFLNGRATVRVAPLVERLSTDGFEDDEPAIAVLSGGAPALAVAWVAYKDRADRVFLRTRAGGTWSAAEEVTPEPADIFRCSLAAASEGGLWVFWSQRENERWQIWGREKKSGGWQPAQRVSDEGSNTFHRAAASARGDVFVTWQSFRAGQSDIVLRAYRNGSWSQEVRLSESAANDWEPALAAGADGTVHVAWDGYERGNYDIYARSWREGVASPVRAVTSSPRFQAHVSVAVDRQNQPWLAWDESGVNWGKDQGFLIPTPRGTPLHQERWIRLARGEGNQWMETLQRFPESVPAGMKSNAEHPQIAFDGGGGLGMVFRHWTRRASRQIGSPMVWENYFIRFDGVGWTTPQPIPSSGSWIEKHPALARDGAGALWAAWMTDNRPFRSMRPANADVYVARLGGPSPLVLTPFAWDGLREAFEEAIPTHPREAADVRAIRDYTIRVGEKPYKIYRGDMHRHTDISQDFKYDGSLIEVYRYGLDAAGFDYIAPTDHQTGFDQEYSWWQSQKLVDLFLVSGRFVPLFAYERSLPYPNGHRNIVWARRGVRTLPVPPEETSGATGAGKLFEHLRQSGGISMPHSSATGQGTDWRDNDPEVEPLMEIYQGYRASYEYEGAPRAATKLNQHAQKSGWQPEGFWWNALAKGYKLGVQASSDHWSTHISYASIVAESFTREGLLEAMRKRHAYAATDNIIVDFRARAGGAEYLMGDVILNAGATQEAPQLLVRIGGTGAIQQIDLIKNRTFLYTTHPQTREASFEYTDKNATPGESWYYVRVLQEDGQLAWSSPIWVKR